MNIMGEELATIAKQQRTILNLMNEITEFKKRNEEQQNKVNFLEAHVSDLEQYTRMNDVLITGLKIKPRSYAHAVNGEMRDESADRDDSTEAQVTAFLHDKNMSINRHNIEACHIIPTRK